MDALITYGLMAGFGLLFIVTPALALATLLWAGLAEGDKELFKHVFIFVGYVIWVPMVSALILVIPGIGNTPWSFLCTATALLLWCIPHLILLVHAKRGSNRRKIWISLFGLLTILSATVGIEMILLFGALSD